MRRNILQLAVLLVLCGALLLTSCQKKEDPTAFTQATLDLYLQGEADHAAKLIKDQTKAELLTEYKERVAAFNEVYITGGMDMSDSMSAQYSQLCKEILRSMRYKVMGAEEGEDNQYHVTVEITPSDIFSQYLPKLSAESDRLLAKVQAGEYEGTSEEINIQLQQEFAYNAYELLTTSYMEMEYGEPETLTLLVTKDDDGQLMIAEDTIWDFIIKILGLDEIQG